MVRQRVRFLVVHALHPSELVRRQKRAITQQVGRGSKRVRDAEDSETVGGVENVQGRKRGREAKREEGAEVSLVGLLAPPPERRPVEWMKNVDALRIREKLQMTATEVLGEEKGAVAACNLFVPVVDARVGIFVIRVLREQAATWKRLLNKVQSFQPGKLLHCETIHVAGSVVLAKKALERLYENGPEEFQLLRRDEWQSLVDQLS